MVAATSACWDSATSPRRALGVADGGFCYGYHCELDLLGHFYGPGSQPWRMQLRQVDRLVESILEELPAGGLLAVVADHGMVAIGCVEAVDIDAYELLLDGVDAFGGEPRARHVYVDCRCRRFGARGLAGDIRREGVGGVA